jgi:hypothetical protein
MHGSLPLSPRHYLTRPGRANPARRTHAPRSYVWIDTYIGPVPAKGPVRALLVRRGERVFIKRDPGADSYDVVVRVYSFPRRGSR